MDDWSQFATSVFRVNSLLVLAGETITRPLGQSSARWQVLGRLWEGGKTVAELAREIGHARQSVQRVADALERDGLLNSRAKPGDRRTDVVELTEDGRRVLHSIYDGQVVWSQRVTSKVPQALLTDATKALVELARFIEAEIETESNNH